jgi:protoheme IX farnesyltransferase
LSQKAVSRWFTRAQLEKIGKSRYYVKEFTKASLQLYCSPNCECLELAAKAKLTSMTTISSPVTDLASIHIRTEQRGLISLYAELTKARLSALVLMTTAVGFILASTGSIDWLRLLWTVIGTALAAGCASALNQIIEINLDKRMLRTRGRPLPSGAMSVAHCFAAGMLMGAAGLIILVLRINLTAGWLALATIVIYAIIYTPLKVRSTLNTIVGAICGAIPPMIGWVAASNSLDIGAWVLAAILFVWQLPHFFALAWLYREDYARGGFEMLPVVDRRGQVTCQTRWFMDGCPWRATLF